MSYFAWLHSAWRITLLSIAFPLTTQIRELGYLLLSSLINLKFSSCNKNVQDIDFNRNQNVNPRKARFFWNNSMEFFDALQHILRAIQELPRHWFQSKPVLELMGGSGGFDPPHLTYLYPPRPKKKCCRGGQQKPAHLKISQGGSAKKTPPPVIIQLCS